MELISMRIIKTKLRKSVQNPKFLSRLDIQLNKLCCIEHL